MPQETILLADESLFFLTMEKQFLRNVPAKVLEVQSAAQVLELCRTSPPQLIFLADTLADQDGVACCRALKADPALAGIPVVFVSETAVAAEPRRCCANGCSAVLSKPLDRYRFLETGRRFLAGIRERRRSCLIGVTASSAGLQLAGRGLDISSGGLFFDAKEQLAVGSELQLELHLSRPNEPGPTIRCSGVVAWLNTRENPMKPHHPVGFGIKFTPLAPRAAELLDAYLKNLDQQQVHYM